MDLINKRRIGGLRAVPKIVFQVLAAIGMVAPLMATAQVACDGRLFLSQDAPTGLNLISTATNPMTFQAVGPVSSVTYNALGYSPVDGVLYAMRTDSNGDHLLSLNQTNGAVTDLGAVSGLPASPVYNTGTVGANGTYYVKPLNNTSVMYAINTATKVATTITLTQAFTASDMAWVGGAGGMLYSVSDGGQLFSISTTGTVTPLGAPDTTSGAGVLGAQFGGTNGLFGSANNGSGFYKINLTTGQKTLMSGAPGSGTNDGANCPNAAIRFPADLGITKTDGKDTYVPGTNVVYTITVTNKGPFTATGAQVGDTLPAGITSASWSCVASSGGTCAASGTGGITDTVTLPKDGTATYTLTMAVPAGFTGNLVNTASVAAGPDNVDPNPEDNSATDTNTGPIPPRAPTPVPVDSPWMLSLAALLVGFLSRRALAGASKR